MAHQATNRRTVATPDTQTLMDPTHKKHPKPTPFSSTAAAAAAANPHHHHHPHPPTHPLPDPSIPPPSTIQTISHRFSKLYANHKRQLASKSLKPSSNGGMPPHLPLHPQPETDFQTKNLIASPVFDTSCTTLTKSCSQHERNTGIIDLGVAEVIKKKDHTFPTKTKLKEKDEIKKLKRDPPKKPSFEDDDVKKAAQLMSKSLENKFQQKGVVEGMRRQSISSMPPPLVSGGRRRSFCSSQVELADFFSCNGVKVVAVDMPPFMQIHAVDCARKTHDSLEKFTSKTLAFTLKKEFDGVYGPAWHCIVGTSFGSFVTHSVGGFMYFSLDHKIYILLFKTTVQRAE